VLRLRDTGTATRVPVPIGGRRTRVLIADGDGPVLRRALTADLIRRVVELEGGQADVRTSKDLPDLLAYNIHPAPLADPGWRPDVVVGSGTGVGPSLAIGGLFGAPPASADPLVVRLCLLTARHGDPATLDAAELGSASARLGRWRRLVREWADAPSGRMPAGHLADLLDRAADDLDTQGMLAVAEAAAGDESVPAGGRFELLLHADRLLGLDLAADLHG
jgi:hypothetical protein